MSKLAFVADVHIGNPTTFGGPVVCGVNNRGAHVLDSLRRAVEAAKDCDTLVLCGDLFDTSHPSPQLVTKVQEILSEGPRVLALLGNHDMVSSTIGDHALGPLAALPNVYLSERPEIVDSGDCQILSVPFQPGDAREWFPSTVAQLVEQADPNKVKVLVFHLGVADETTPSFLRGAHDAIELEVVEALLEEHGIMLAFCGNWHGYKDWGRVVQCGALCPTGWDNPGWDYGMVHTLDTRTGLKSKKHVKGPRFLTVTSMEAALICHRQSKQRGCPIYLNLKQDAVAGLDEIRDWPMVHGARAVADGEEAREATREAARAVKGASTLNDALARYIGQMPIADGVDRQKVQAMSKHYLAQGGAS